MHPARSRHLLAAAVTAAIFSAPSAHAAARYWVNSSTSSNANWSNTANWSATSGGSGGASIPTSFDTAVINFNDPNNQSTLNPILDISASLTTLGIGSNSTGVPTLFQNTNTTLSVSGTELIGYLANGRGAYTQSAGTNIPTGLLSIGDATSSLGTYNLSASAILRPGANTYIGNHGTGTFNQTGGSFSTIHSLYLAYDTASSGTYNLQTGSLVTGSETIGFNNSATGSAIGSFIQSGGTHSTSSLYLGYNSGSTGSYSLSDPSASLSVSSITVVGANKSASGTSSGTFSQSAGTFTTGTLTVASANPGSTATGLFSLGPSASLSVTGTATIAYNSTGAAPASATGSFLQTGGSFSAQNLNIGSSATSSAGGAAGFYSLSAGTLSVPGIVTIGDSLDTGSFLQTGGAHTTGQLVVNANSSYSLSGPSASLAETNASIDGTFTHTAGTHSVGAGGFTGLSIGGAYSLSGTASLLVNGLQIVGGGALYSQSAGTAVVGSAASPQRLVVGFYNSNNPGATATYSLSGTASSEVYGSFDLGSTDFTDGVTGSPGALNITGGTLTVHGPIQLFSPPTGSNSIHIDGGSLTLTTFTGSAATPVDVSNGTLSFTSPDPITLGSSSPAIITLGPGGHLSAASFVLSAGASLTLNGGFFEYSNSLTLAGATLTGTSLLSNSSQLSGFGTLAGTGGLDNSGSLSIPSGTLSLPSTGPLSSSGLLSLSPGSQLSLTGSPLSNTGLIQLSPGSRISGTATLANSPGGVIQGAGTISTPLTNSPGATLLIQTGTLNLTQPTTSSGTIQLVGPASTLSGASLSNTGTLHGDGTVTNPLSNTGEIRADSSQSLTLSNMPTNAGTLNLQGGSLSFSLPLTNNSSITSRGGSLTSPSLTNNSTILLTAGSTDFHTPLTSSPASSITLTAGATATFFSPVTLQPGSQFHLAPNSAASFLAPLTGQSQFTGPGIKDFESGASAPSSLDTAGQGATVVESAASLTTSTLHESSLTLYGPLTLTTNSPASSLSTLLINPTGSLDLSNNTLTITSISPDTLRSYLFTHQLFSSLSDSTHTLAYSFSDGPQARVFPSLPGDLNLDGKINADDYALLDRSFAKNLTDPHWTDGDFNYDGVVNSADYLLIDRSLYQAQGFSPGFLSQRESQFGPTYIAQLLTSLPEPSILYPLSSLLFLPRRRYKST